MRTTYITIKYRKVSFCLLLTFWGENWKNVNSLVTHNCALLSISARFGFFFVYTKKNFDHVRMVYSI